MTYTEWAATVERGVTITPQMAFLAGRPARPKMKKVKMLCYLDDTTQQLVWSASEHVSGCWIRVPSEDKEIQIEC